MKVSSLFSCDHFDEELVIHSLVLLRVEAGDHTMVSDTHGGLKVTSKVDFGVVALSKRK